MLGGGVPAFSFGSGLRCRSSVLKPVKNESLKLKERKRSNIPVKHQLLKWKEKNRKLRKAFRQLFVSFDFCGLKGKIEKKRCTWCHPVG